jgi:hypothetical protein
VQTSTVADSPYLLGSNILSANSNPYYQVGYMLAFIKNAMMELPEFEDLLLKHIEFMKYKKKENNENNFKN